MNSINMSNKGEDFMKKDSQIDKSCLQCKVIGVLTFMGTGAYASYLRMNTPIGSKGQRLYLGCVGIGSLAIALWRMSVD